MSASSAERMPTILLTGATGYIASHTWLELLAAGAVALHVGIKC